MKNLSKEIIAISLILIIIAMSACQTNTTQIQNKKNELTIENQVKATNFQTQEEYQQFIKNTVETNSYYGMIGGLARTFDSPIMVADTMMMEKTAASIESTIGSSNDFSQTNVQVQGIDEGDIIKTDGEYIYTITDKTLFIIKAYPGEDSKIISTIKLKNRPTGLFIENNKLAIFGNIDYNNIYAEAKIRIRNGMTFIELYDISNKNNPELEKTYKFEGNYLESRIIGGEIFLLTNTYPEQRIIQPMPIIMEDDSAIQVKPTDIEYFNINYQNPMLVGINKLNIKNNELDQTKMVAVEGQPTIYMSQNNIYLAHREYINEWDLRQQITQKIMEPELPEYYKLLISKLENADTDILSPSEKRQKISELYSEYLYAMNESKIEEIQEETELKLQEKIKELKYLEYTVINKVNIENKIKTEANNKIPGTLNNQFSMDEYKDVLRIATTSRERYIQEIEATQKIAADAIMPRMPSWNSETKNNVYTLDENLKIIGRIEGLAKGESIFSTRFMEDKLYMVTFRQTDPFFVIDLSNPKNPKNLGELKIPGFSRYLHPYDKNTIIGIGRDATQTGRTQGLKISLFDVTDTANPKEIAKYVSNQKYSSTSAEWEHKAFLFNKQKELLVIPAYNYNYQDQSENYNGALVFKITKDDIELRGLIDHSEGTSNNWSPRVERSLFIENELYTKSPYLLRINDLEDLSKIKNIKLETKNEGPIPIY